MKSSPRRSTIFYPRKVSETFFCAKKVSETHRSEQGKTMKLEDWYKETERPEERELRRKLRRAAIWEWIGYVVLLVLGIVLFWLYLAATPPQSSAINDLEEEGATERARQNQEARP